jgi:hypothetical protein
MLPKTLLETSEVFFRQAARLFSIFAVVPQFLILLVARRYYTCNKLAASS